MLSSVQEHYRGINIILLSSAVCRVISEMMFSQIKRCYFVSGHDITAAVFCLKCWLN